MLQRIARIKGWGCTKSVETPQAQFMSPRRVNAQKTVEVQQVQFSEQVMDVPVVMQDKCVRFRRAYDFEANADPVHRQDRRCSRVATTSTSQSQVEKTVKVPQVQ